jgi:hypothetical protein
LNESVWFGSGTGAAFDWGLATEGLASDTHVVHDRAIKTRSNTQDVDPIASG